MFRAIALALICSNAWAYLVPLGSRRAVVNTGIRIHLEVNSLPLAFKASARPAPVMRYIAMNRFKVKLGCEEEFEAIWRERESKLASFSGFQEFMLLRLDSDDRGDGDGESDKSMAGYTEFISHTTWAHELDYQGWRNSQGFKKSHSKDSKDGKPSAGGTPGGMSKMSELIVERPSPALFDAVIIEPTPPEHKGGLFDFENDPSYFDGDL